MDGSVRREDNLVPGPATGTGNFDGGPPVMVRGALALALQRRFDGVATPRTTKSQAKQEACHAAFVLEGEGFQIVRLRRRRANTLPTQMRGKL